jgi:hypothetical protein
MARTDSILSKFPGFYPSGDRYSVLYRWIEVFGSQVDAAEEDLIRVMRSHWVNTANNEGLKGRPAAGKGDLDKIFALYLQALGGTSLLKQAARRKDEEGIEDDKIFRTRLSGLVKVLRNGASTKSGIIAIVAANLGIVGDSDKANQARNSIRIEEFLPEQAPTQTLKVAPYEGFRVENLNGVDITPQIRITINVALPKPLVNPCLVNLDTGESARYEGTLLRGDELSFLTDGTAMLSGKPVPIVGKTPKIRPGYTRMRIQAGYGMPAGRFDVDTYDYSRFELEQLTLPGTFDQAKWDESVFSDGTQILNVLVDAIRYIPGAFNVRIPWDIPSYSEALETLEDKPREQIPFIVDKVKAAGTVPVITYEKRFGEEQGQAVELTIQDRMQPEEQGQDDAAFSINSINNPYPAGLSHELGDTLQLSGVFDFTTFDSLNTFI